MKINSKIFRAYDIRGLYPEEINKQVAYKLGQAFVKFIKKKKKTKKLDILIARDNRPSSLALARAISSGVASQGANVIDLGVCTTPMFYFASKYYRLDDGGVMVTASHLPWEYNGFKMVKDVPIPIDARAGLKEIKKIAVGKILKTAKRRGKISHKHIMKEYLKFNLRDFDLSKIISLKIVIDTGNTPTTLVVPGLFRKAKFKVIHTDPYRSLNCTEKENLVRLKREVLKNKADLGIIFDGDGDRISFINEKGQFIS